MLNKNYAIIGLSLVIAILLIFKGCEKPVTNESNLIQENEILLNKIDSIDKELAILSVVNDSLELSYKSGKEIKDSIIYHIKNKYIAVYDTITKDTIECLPKPQVDTLINTYELLLIDCDTLISTKDDMISNLSTQNNIKDTIISNKDEIIEIKETEIKRQKKKKFGAFLKGLGLGLVGGLFY